MEVASTKVLNSDLLVRVFGKGATWEAKGKHDVPISSSFYFYY